MRWLNRRRTPWILALVLPLRNRLLLQPPRPWPSRLAWNRLPLHRRLPRSQCIFRPLPLRAASTRSVAGLGVGPLGRRATRKVRRFERGVVACCGHASLIIWGRPVGAVGTWRPMIGLWAHCGWWGRPVGGTGRMAAGIVPRRYPANRSVERPVPVVALSEPGRFFTHLADACLAMFPLHKSLAD